MHGLPLHVMEMRLEKLSNLSEDTQLKDVENRT